MKCNNCGLEFDESDLSQVIAHEHQIEMSIEPNVGKKVISHARDIYPNASIQFCMGVNNFLSGDYDISRMYQESRDFMLGYWQAEIELKDKYILKR